MFASCPNCNKYFSIRTEHLNAAYMNKKAKCGVCKTFFNLFVNLHDELPKKSAPTVSQKPVAEDIKHTPLTDEISSLNTDSEDILPAWLELSADLPPSSSSRSTLFSVLSLFAIIVFGLQVVWFQRDLLLSQYPILLPHTQKIFAHFDLPLFYRRDLDAIVLVSRDVRWHPHQQDGLLVNATIKNEAKMRQPFPNIQFILFDIAGKVVAHRTFPPEEYLDQNVDLNLGMPPDKLVDLIFALKKPEAHEAGFEFNFF